jgi:hypothetical protein
LGAGCVFLTKPDIFIALMLTAAAVLALYWAGRQDWRCLGRSLAGFVAASLLAPLFFFVLFLRVENWHSSLHSVVFGWVPLLGTPVPHNPYYARFSGLDHPTAHLQEMATHFLFAGLLIGVYAVVFRRLGRWAPRRPAWRWLVWLGLILPLLVCAWRFDWTSCGASLPLWCVVIIACLVWRFRHSGGAPQFTYPLVWTVFALLLTAKMGLYCRVWHYGFVLAMPAFAAAVYFLLWLLPSLLEECCQTPAKYFRAMILPALLIGFLFLWGFSEHMYAFKHQPIGSGGDQIVTFGPSMDQGDAVKIALDWMNRNLPAHATLAVVPTGITLNYLTRRVNPTPCLFWDPNLLAVCGQKEMTERFEARAPDYVLLVGGDHSEWNIEYFGSDPSDGAEVMGWIRKNYQRMVVIGHEPLRDNQFGMEFLKHTPPSASGPATTGNH